MSPSEAKAALGQLCKQAREVYEIAKTAERGGKSLGGDNFYGHKFHDGVAALFGTLSRVRPTFARLTTDDARAACGSLTTGCEVLRSLKGTATIRMRALKQIELACEEHIYPALDLLSAPAIPVTEQVLPMAVVQGTRGYLQNMIIQANGCYERGWFDAASVMLRKFVETLIVEVYEKAGRADEIKSAKNDNFLALGELVDFLLADRKFNLAREAKATLPLVKAMGDRSAHTRRYLATRPDVDRVIPGLRIVADDLLHLAGLK